MRWALQDRAAALAPRVRGILERAYELEVDAAEQFRVNEILRRARALLEDAETLGELARSDLPYNELERELRGFDSDIERIEDELGTLNDELDELQPAPEEAPEAPRPNLRYPANQLPVQGAHPYVPPNVAGAPPFVRAPAGGYLDANGNVWEWARDPHGGPHWDVQHADGTHTNVFPDGTILGPDNF
jgi:Bacterial toxin 37